MKYITKAKNIMNTPMVLESFSDDDSLYGFYWEGDTSKWGISDCGTVTELINRINSLISLSQKQLAEAKNKNFDTLIKALNLELNIYDELIQVLVNM